MTWAIPDLVLAPLVPWPVIAVPAALAFGLAAVAIARRARGAWWRLLPLLVLVLALLNPRLAGEERTPLDDVAVVLVDDSLSQTVGDRRTQTEAALAAVRERLGRLSNLEVRVERLRQGLGQDEGTALYGALRRALGDVPRRRLAGAVLITDGQVHDMPEGAPADVGAPVHVLLTGQPGERDRRLIVEQAPSFGIVGDSVRLRLRVEDPGAAGSARVTMRRDGGQPAGFDLPLNASRYVSVPITHGGVSVLELEAAAGANELSLANNRAALTVNGVRDRLRVLLVSGEPHPGERTWRNLLKADPSVDLVHFTILRPPEKDDATPLRELALISFPIRELFEEKLDDFDLIIFDRYRRRVMMPLDYYDNIVNYVRRGGALLMAVGPEFNDPFNLSVTPIENVLPATPGGDPLAEGFVPRITDLGKRHPVTAGLPGGETEPPVWGRWLRQVVTEQRSGVTVMTGAADMPLLILDHVGEGRVAQILSDTIWLWSRGFEGGGPQGELLRRLAHWLMKEPALEEDVLRAEVRGQQLHIERRSLEPGPPEATVTLPDGSERRVRLSEQDDGRAVAALTIDQSGLYRVTDGSRTAVAAAGSLNPIEMAELPATPDRLKPVVEASGGGLRWLASEGIPDFRQVAADRAAVGRGWWGLNTNREYLVTAVRDLPLLPGPLLLLLGVGGLVTAWWREGR